jgi:hypothetical protein
VLAQRIEVYLRTSVLVLLVIGCYAQRASAFAYVFAGEANGVDVVTHSMGYTGAGGTVNITVGIDQTSANANAMVISTQNAVHTWDNLIATTGNIVGEGANNVPAGSVDFESVLLHEMGHALGLAHMNLASESMLPTAQQNYTKSTNGANNVFNINAGTDGIIGSADDLRGDDVNLNYFRMSNNNPFTIASTVDSTTYSRNTANLPAGDNFSANADRAVGAALGVANTEAVMQQGTFFDEAQRTLGHDDVAGIRYAMTGIDEIAGTGDDYTLNISYIGLTNSADILIDFDNSTAFAQTNLNGQFILGTDHVRVTQSPILFNTGFNWYFNDVSSVPEPSSMILLSVAGIGVLGAHSLRRRKSQAADEQKTA